MFFQQQDSEKKVYKINFNGYGLNAMVFIKLSHIISLLLNKKPLSPWSNQRNREDHYISGKVGTNSKGWGNASRLTFRLEASHARHRKVGIPERGTQAGTH